VLENPSGPHQRARRSGCEKASKTCAGVASISREWMKLRAAGAVSHNTLSRCSAFGQAWATYGSKASVTS